jgi:hypothetical protein
MFFVCDNMKESFSFEGTNMQIIKGEVHKGALLM